MEKEGRPVFFLDETSTCMWAVKKRTWTNEIHPVTVPLQNSRGRSRTIIGAVGVVDGQCHFFYDLAESTNQEAVVGFFEKMKREATFDISTITVVTDNHSSHKSRLVRNWFASNQVPLMFLPVYSSTLSPVERVWAIFKSRWAKELCKVQVRYDVSRMDSDIRLVMEQVRGSLQPSILRAADKHIARVHAGQLV